MVAPSLRHYLIPWDTLEVLPSLYPDNKDETPLNSQAVHSYLVGSIVQNSATEETFVSPNIERRVCGRRRARRSSAPPLRGEPARLEKEGWGVVTNQTIIVIADPAFSVYYYDIDANVNEIHAREWKNVCMCHDINITEGLLIRFSREDDVSPILLHGSPGTGKTQLIKSLARHLRKRLVIVSAGKLGASAGIHADRALRKAIEYCAYTGGICLLDGIDRLFPSEKGRVGGSLTDVDVMMRNVLVQETSKERFTNLKLNFTMVGVTSHLPSLHATARHCFGEEIEIVPPTPLLRTGILLSALESCNACEEMVGEVPGVAAAAHGFSAGDLYTVATAATSLYTCTAPADRAGLLWRALDSARVAVTLARGGSTTNEDGGTSTARTSTTNIRWDDVGGLANAKAALREAAVWPQIHARAFMRMGVSPPLGVLLFGPPGTGKTLLARAAAAETGAHFVELRASEVVRGAVGDSEKEVEKVFKTARDLAPAIIFIDEFQALFADRSSGDGSNVSSKLASQLLLCMDELTRWHNAERDAGGGTRRVVVLAATNVPQAVDRAFLRPGRFDKIIYAGLPNEAERREIFSVSREKARAEGSPWSEDVDIHYLASITGSYSGADIAALVRCAAVASLQTALKCASADEIKVVPPDHLTLDAASFAVALKRVQPSNDMHAVKSFENWMESHKTRRRSMHDSGTGT